MAMSYPTIHVKNFARIKEAAIELAPLTLFVGDNNSCKSYLSSLIWGFSQQGLLKQLFWEEDFFEAKRDSLSNTPLLQNWIEQGSSNESHDNEIVICEEDHIFLVSLINDFFEHVKKGFIEAIFGRQIDIGHLSLDLPYDGNRTLCTSVRLNWISVKDYKTGKFVMFGYDGNFLNVGKLIHNVEGRNAIWKLLGEVARAYLYSYFHDSSSFFPASRTGFLLTYKSLIDKSLEKSFGSRLKSENQEDSQLTMPQRFFLRSLAALRNNNTKKREKPHKIQSLIEFIEKKLIGGNLSLNDLPVSDLLYRPDGLEDDLPMFLSSGVVTEIAPLLSHLKYDSRDNRCVIEEPEMSLHPELQRRMAQVLIRLSKLLDSVLVTTHSDIIIQHINNMIKLDHRAEDGKELAAEHGYDANEDIISSDRVRMYQFDTEQTNHQTVVTKLDPDVNGFPVPTFGEALRTLRNDVIAFYNDDESPKPKREPVRRIINTNRKRKKENE
jgi:AAA15 family ATPase/GTPase